MATSRKQIEANRRNAQRSTGPTSAHGKSITCLNAKRDGFTGQIITLSEEDRPVFDQFREKLVADLKPNNVTETNLADAIAWDTWRINHIRAVEISIYALGTEDPETMVDCGDDPLLHDALSGAKTFLLHAKKFGLMSLYEQRMSRSLHKNMEALRDLQAERKQQYERDLAEQVLLARGCEISNLPYQAPLAATPNGSVFSNEEVLTAARRQAALEAAWKAIQLAANRISPIDRTPVRTKSAAAGASFSADPPAPTPLLVTPVTSQGGGSPIFLSR